MKKLTAKLVSIGQTLISFLFIPIFLTACSGGGNPSPGMSRVGLTIQVPSTVEKTSAPDREKSLAPAPAPIAAIGVSVVDAEGRLLTSTRVAVSPGQEVTITLEVPAGRARNFTVQAIDETGIVLFQGQASADLTAGTPTSLAIRMEPINLIPTLSISPTTLSILVGKTQLFTATLTGPADPALIWSVNDIQDGNPAFGTITPSSATTATYTAPATLPDSNPVTIKVSSASNPELAATAVVTLLTAPSTVFIDSEIGVDSPECGTESAPCKTITQGLALAQAGQTLLVASGTYNFGNGTGDEPAPLTMKTGVDIQGAGAEVTILNLNDTNDPDNAGILGADTATLSGFTIQDEDSVQFHISLTGTTTISDNRFIDLCPQCNTAIRVWGNGAPTIIGNTFGQIGFGLTTALVVEDTASPAVARNTFSGNRTAIETRLSATPKIEANTITGNGIGISIRNNSNPDLGGGKQGSTGGNILSCNADTDLNIITSNEIAARNNFWDHVPPRQGGSRNGVDIDGDSPSPDTGNASFATNPCRVRINSPLDGTVVRGDVRITAAAQDPAGVASVDYDINGISIGSGLPTTFGLQFNSASSQFQQGVPLTLTATQVNNANTASDADSIRITIDNTPPSVSITAPRPNQILPCGPVSITATASDSISEILRVEFFRVSGNVETKIGEDTTTPYTLDWSPISNGPYTVRAKATDRAGNIGTSSDVTFTYNCITSITIAPPSVTVRKGARQTFTVSPTAPVNWRVQNQIGGGGTVGFIATDGTYTAPGQIPVQGNVPIGVTVDAVLTSNGAASNAASVRVITGPTLKFSPNEAVTKELSIKPPTSTDSSGQRNIAYYNGQIFITWSARQLRADGWDVLFAESSDGKNWKMTTVAGGVDNQVLEPQPALAAGADGTVYILYRAEKNSSGPCSVCPQTIEMATRRPGDQAFNIQILDQRGKDGQTVQDPTLVVSPEGVVFAAWSANFLDTGFDIHFQRIGKDGKPIDATPRNLTGIVGAFNESQPVLSTNDGKEVFIAWQQFANTRDIIVSASRDGGNTFPFISAPVNDKGPGQNPSIAAGPEGRVYVAWETDECNENCLSVYFSAGTVGDKLIFDTSTRLPELRAIDQLQPSIAWNPSDGILIAFNEFVSDFGDRIFLAKSIDEGKTFLISDISQESSTIGSVKSAPSITVDTAGRVFAVWTDARNASPGSADVFSSMGE
jgi:hypothetical protein